VGQVKLSADQQRMAYTVDKDGSEVFEARLQSIEGALYVTTLAQATACTL